ncbi:MAG: hypothetical protein ACK55P_22965 [Planctomyces sp.]
MADDAQPAANSGFLNPQRCSQTRKTAKTAGFDELPATSPDRHATVSSSRCLQLPSAAGHFGSSDMGRIEVHNPGIRSQRPRLLAPALWLLALSPLIADDPPVRSVRDTVVDQLLLQDGTRLKGVAVARKPPQLLVRTSWLKQHAPDFLERSVRPVARTSLQANAQRLKVLLTEAAAKQPAGEQESDPPGNLARTTLLQEVLQRLEPDEDVLPTHVVVESLRSTFRTADLRTDAQRMLGLRAMAADIADFEQLHWKTVAARLQQSAAAAPGPAEPAADMTEAQLQQIAWCILAAIDVRTNEALKLVRSGTAFIDEASRPDPAQLLQVAAGQSTRGLLQDLLDEASGQPVSLNAGKESVHGVLETLPTAAADMARARQKRTVVVSEFTTDLNSGQAAVRRSLWYQAADEKWHLTAAVTGTATAGEHQVSDLAALHNDPQVQQIAALSAALGLQQQLQTALGMGAVVQRALQNAATQLEDLLQQALTARLLTGKHRPLLIRETAVKPSTAAKPRP